MSMKMTLGDSSNSELFDICNFNVKVIKTIKIIGTHKDEIFVSVELHFNNGEIQNTNLPLSKLEQIEWSDIDSRCILLKNTKSVKERIAAIIRSQLTEGAPQEIQLNVDKVGLIHYNGTIGFVIGGEGVITPSHNNSFPVCRLNNVSLNLDFDKNISIIDTIEGMVELVSLCSGIGWLLLDHTLSGIMREAFVIAGIIPETILMIVGKSGMLKSSYVPQITQIYNRNEGVKANTRFNSSKRFIEDTLSMYRHCTVVIDDLHTASTSSIKRQNEATAEEIIRRISDNVGRGRKNGDKSVQQYFEGNVVFIGEYTVGAESTIPRVLVAEMTKKPDGVILDKYQRLQPLLVPTFYKYFIQWYVDNFEVICEIISDRLSQFRSLDVLPWIHGRLRDALFCLQMSHMIMLEYCLENDFIKKNIAMESFANFELYVTSLIIAQQNRFSSQNKCSTDINYLSIIGELYHSGAFKLAKNMEEFDSSKHDGIVHYDCLCLRKECFERSICQRCGRDIKSLIAYLKFQGALKMGKKGNTIQIKGGKRLYAIYLDKLG